MAESQPELQPLLRPEDIESTPVYPIIHMIRSDVTQYIDTPLTYEALLAPDLTYTLVRPLVEKYLAIQQDGNLSVVFCCLLNRVHFMRDDHVGTATLSRSRAHLCEILATRIFRDNAHSILRLILVLTTTWPVYSGADPLVISQARQERDDDLAERVGNAIEMAILGKAKRFIKSSSCQKVIDGIWSGKCVYQAQSSHSILSDTYKRTPIHFYDPHKAPLLDHYRLKVPSIRSVLEYMNFLILFILFIFAIEFNERGRLNASEIAFMVYALGFTLEKVATMQENGINVYFKGTWNGFDLAFITAYCIYATFRLYGVAHQKQWVCNLGTDVLALIACLMFPRLAFVTFKDNLLVLSLRAMIMQFIFLMVIATFCFCGFLYALWTLSRGQANYGLGSVAWWMLELYLGLDANGFDRSGTFHPVFGPMLMIAYACLSNTLLLTVLVSILSNTFASVNEDAATEAMFRKAILTIEGVKVDSLFSYQPPINLVALCIMLPASYVLSPRWFHKVNVFTIRLTSFPILLAISYYERQSKRAGSTNFYGTVSHVVERVFETLPRSLKRLTFFEGLAGAGADIDAIFEVEEEYDSALDTADIGDGHPGQTVTRTPTSSFRRERPFPPSSPPKVIPQRPKINLMARPFDSQMLSPLAQAFNSINVDDDIIEEPGAPGTTPSPQGISYGPASRRRLLSIQSQRQGLQEYPMGQIHSHPMRRLRSLGDDPATPRSHPQEIRHAWPPSRVTDVKAEDGDEGEFVPGVVDRLNGIEKRQERIETLLREISQNLGHWNVSSLE